MVYDILNTLSLALFSVKWNMHSTLTEGNSYTTKFCNQRSDILIWTQTFLNKFIQKEITRAMISLFITLYSYCIPSVSLVSYFLAISITVMIALYNWMLRCYLIHIKYVYLQYSFGQNTSDMRENLLRSDNKKGFFSTIISNSIFIG